MSKIRSGLFHIVNQFGVVFIERAAHKAKRRLQKVRRGLWRAQRFSPPARVACS